MAPRDRSPFHRDLGEDDVLLAVESASHRKIVASCISDARSVKQISEDTGIPLASAYRQINTLCDSDVLVIERSAMTRDGKAYDLFRARVRQATLRVTSAGTDVSWELNMPIEDRLLRMWDQMRMA